MIEIGQRVKDVVTGFSGIASGRTTFINGCVQFLVQPSVASDGKYPEGEWIDHQRLIADGDPLQPAPKVTASDLLGKRVKDRVSGFTGIVINTTVSLSGQVRHGVRPAVGADGKMPAAEWFYHTDVDVVDDGVKISRSDTGADSHPDAPPTR